MNLSADNGRAVAVLLGGVALLAVLWSLAINPKRNDSTKAGERADQRQQSLDEATAKVGAYIRDKARFAANKAELRRLDKAVPVRGDIAVLLRSLQAEARRRGADLRVIALKEGGAQTGSTPVPGAQIGPSGLSQLPFNLQFSGRYHDLLHVLRTVRRAVGEDDGKVTARGRLMTIDGIGFKAPSEASSSRITATINATAYVAPDPSAAPPVAAAAAGGAAPPVAAAGPTPSPTASVAP